MKKLLSIILALTMLASMIPAVFAGDAEEPVSVTFTFIDKGRSDVSQTSFESIKKVDDTTYTSSWTNYKDFPENPASPDENWAYAGSTITGAVSSNSFVNATNYAGTGFATAANQWVAFKIKVPKTATYKLSNMHTYKYQNATTALEIYIFPSDERFTEGNAIYGSVVPPTDPNNSKLYANRSNVTDFEALKIANPVLLAMGSEQVAKADAAYGDVTFGELNTAELIAGEEYILLFNNALSGKAITVKSVTLTEVVEGEDVNLITNPEYNFTRSAVKDTSITKITAMKDSSKLDSGISTGMWKTHFDNTSNSQFASDGALFCGYKAAAEDGNIIWVVNAQADKAGVYAPTISFVRQPYNGIVDFYAIPTSYAVEKQWTLSTVAEVAAAIADADVEGSKVSFVASIDMHKDSGTETEVVGNSAYFSLDNYIIIRVRKGPNKSNHNSENYYGYVSSIKLNPVDTALSLKADDTSFAPGETRTIVPSAIGADGSATTISSITYESLTPSIATVNSATGVITAIADGEGKIKATAVVGDKTVTAELTVTIKKIWDPKFVFTSEAVRKATSTGSTYPIQNVRELKDEVSTGKWEYVNLRNIDGQALYGDGIQYRCMPTYFLEDGVNDNAIIVKLNFSETGTYLATFAGMKRAYCGKNNIYLVSKSYADSKWKMTSDALSIPDVIADPKVEKVVSANLYAEKNEDRATLFTGDTYNVDEKEVYAIIVLGNNDENVINDASRRLWGYPQYLEMTRTGSVKLLADKTTLSKGDTTTLVSTVKDNRDNAYEAEVTYETLNASVATVSGSTVTAVAPGTATIKATATVDGVVVSDTVEITVGEETVKKTVSIATSINGEEDVKSYTRGSKVTVTAPEIEGKVFRHWVRGTAANGDWVSADAEYSFTATTHTYLTAVYTNEVTGKLVEFFNGNGEYLSEAVADENGKVTLPENPSITGYIFDKWLLDKDTEFTADTVLTKDITRVVAGFKDADKTYSVNGVKYKYGEEATFESAIDMVWYRNDEAVAYGKSYTYYVWDEAAISWEKGEAAPMVVLDKEVKDGNAYMIEYDACGKNIVEVGIIFGNGNHTVDSCDSKATSQRGLSRGQFTAKPANDGSSVARGYLVYEENGAYKVVYSK